MKKSSVHEQEVLGLIQKIQEQIANLDRKIDSLINKSLPRPSDGRPAPHTPSPQPGNIQRQGGGRPQEPQRGRPMYRATCADCKKECEIPFKPTGERPVYCKECFMRRKTNNMLQGHRDNKPKAAMPEPSVIHAPISFFEPPVKETKKSSALKRAPAKKKAVAKKKRK